LFTVPSIVITSPVVDFKLLKVFLLSAGFPDFIILSSINGLFYQTNLQENNKNKLSL